MGTRTRRRSARGARSSSDRDAFLAAALVALLGVACDGAGADAATLTTDARAALERDGWSAIQLEAVEGEPEGTFDFTGQYEGQACSGTLVVRGEPGRRTTAISSSCP